MTNEASITYEFTGVSKRIQASIADSVAIVLLMMLLSVGFDAIGDVPRWARIVATVLMLSYDPLFVSFMGGTPGHFLLGMRVRSAKDLSRNINILQAIPRVIVKFLLGSISLLAISGDQRGRALHDRLVNSVVIEVSKANYSRKSSQF